MAKNHEKQDHNKENSQQISKIISSKRFKTRYTFVPKGNLYYMWQLIYLIACIFTTVVYPYYTVFDFPSFRYSTFWWITVMELVCLVQIVMSFFKQELDE